MHAIANALIDNPALQLVREDVFSCTLFSKHSGSTMAPPNLVGMNELPVRQFGIAGCCAAVLMFVLNNQGVWLVGYGLDDAGEKRGWKHLFGCPKVRTNTLLQSQKNDPHTCVVLL